MEGSTFSERLALLPKVSTEERTLVHVQGQKSYAKSYASEGRRYLLSWGDERQRDDPLSGEEEKPLADIDLGTPILKPRVEKLAKPVTLARSLKMDGGNENTNTVISIKSSDSDKDRHQQRIAGKRKSKKPVDTTNNVDKRKGKSTPSQKKRVNECPSDNSSRLERLKERREKKRAKRVVVEVPKSDKENEAEESRETRKKSKKIPVGFALMHGFTATNVGKGRLTVKPSATIGVFNKGKASRRTNRVKSKGSGKNNQIRDDCFSESKFLNKSKREDGPPGRLSSGSSDTSVSSGGIVVRGPSKREKAMESVPDPSEVKSAASPKKPESPSIIRDIEHDNANPCSASVKSHKQGSVVLDTTRHVWANALCKSDAAARSQENSIGPSQSASQWVPDKLDGNRSKYFHSRNQPMTQVQDITKEPLVSLCSFEGESSDDVAGMSVEDQVEKVILPENVYTQNDKVSQLMQREVGYVTHDSAQEFAQLEYDEHMPIDLHLLQPDVLDGDMRERWADYLPCSEFGNLVFDEHIDDQDLQNDEILDQNRSNEDENSDVPDDFHEFTGHFNDDGEVGEFYVLDRDNPSIDEESNSLQVDLFYQGRAMLLLGCTVHESGAPSNSLASAEVDVVKRLRDHWHPRRP